MKRTGVLCLLMPCLIWGIQISSTLYHTMGYQRYVSNRFLPFSCDEIDGEVGARLMLSPDFNISTGISFDGKVDLYLSRRFWTNAIETVIKEVYSEVLVGDVFSTRIGYVAIDYGYNGLFHPLRMVDLTPLISQKTTEILNGTERSGYRGLPLLRGRFSPWIGDISLGVEQNFLFLDATNIFSNYLLSSMKIAYQGTDAGILLGYFPWKQKKEIDSGILGWFLAFQLPGKILLMHEGLYRKRSFWIFFDGNTVVSNRTGDFVNISLEAKQTFVDVFFHGKITWTFEYGFFGEGLSFENISHILDFLTNTMNQEVYGREMIPSYRLFRHWYRGEVGYEIPAWRMGLLYRIIFPDKLCLVSHQLSFSFGFDQARMSLFSGWNVSEERYAFLYGNIPWYMGIYLELPL